MDIYHASMESVHIEHEFEFTPDSIKLFFIKLQGMDAHRIQRPLEEQISLHFIQRQLEETSMGASSEILALTLYKILSQRRLLSDFRIIRVLSKVRDAWKNYDAWVWAKKMVQHFGKIQLTVDDGKSHYMLDVLDEWMCILENEEFNISLLLLDINTTKHLQDTRTIVHRRFTGTILRITQLLQPLIRAEATISVATLAPTNSQFYPKR
ncbi:hypothetical protein PsorP6_005602 [Peronosclerospora sorghi]|uniref:Uncharacterized protein n=1 Tax=Peronosclerospora sorghi TaxID=230839 RepID=A0ACC0W3P1_9STRA|nr:hypothetical protein PsorP6_005602 [Peronosclerospora sorghi]